MYSFSSSSHVSCSDCDYCWDRSVCCSYCDSSSDHLCKKSWWVLSRTQSDDSHSSDLEQSAIMIKTHTRGQSMLLFCREEGLEAPRGNRDADNITIKYWWVLSKSAAIFTIAKTYRGLFIVLFTSSQKTKKKLWSPWRNSDTEFRLKCFLQIKGQIYLH